MYGFLPHFVHFQFLSQMSSFHYKTNICHNWSYISEIKLFTENFINRKCLFDICHICYIFSFVSNVMIAYQRHIYHIWSVCLKISILLSRSSLPILCFSFAVLWTVCPCFSRQIRIYWFCAH